MASRDVPPSASALISSLRGVGYSLETALADIVDNSIAAGARLIDIEMDWNGGDPIVTVLDDGSGMTKALLIEAMRFGGKGPGVLRSEADLGRFGLGLKTASLSQCRQLTVASKLAAKLHAFTWDLDVLQKEVGWNLIDGARNVPKALLKRLESAGKGTLVVWRKVDFGRAEDRPNSVNFLADIERVDRHLGMVFHRFLAGDAYKVEMAINGSPVQAWDPFLQWHKATVPQPAQRVRSPGGAVTIRGFVLPHRDRFRNAAEFEKAGGPEGWNAHQGFYVYRQKRLLSAGGWLGLGGSRMWTREEPSRLARIQVDIPNTADMDWRIDIRKAIARPPDTIRKRLQQIADDVRRRAREVFVHRGAYGPRSPRAEVSRIWIVSADAGGRRYKLNRDHELVRLLRSRLGQSSELLEGVLELVERTVPVERIWLDVTETGAPAEAPQQDKELATAAVNLVRVLQHAGVPLNAAVEKVSAMDPFDRVPDLLGHLTKRNARGAADDEH